MWEAINRNAHHNQTVIIFKTNGNYLLLIQKPNLKEANLVRWLSCHFLLFVLSVSQAFHMMLHKFTLPIYINSINKQQLLLLLSSVLCRCFCSNTSYISDFSTRERIYRVMHTKHVRAQVCQLIALFHYELMQSVLHRVKYMRRVPSLC